MTVRWCIYCKRHTKQRFYDDYRPGKPYAYFQCNRCWRCMYRCTVCKKFTADRGGIDGECTCATNAQLDTLNR